MPVYQITAPDGRKLRITAPEGATQEQALAYAQQQLGQQQADSKQQNYERLLAQFEARQPSDPMHPSNNPTTGMSTFDKIAAGAGKSVADTWQGLQQLTGFANAQDVADRRVQDAPLMATGAGTFGNVVGQTMQMAVPIPGSAGVKLAQVAGKAAPFISAGLRSGVFSGLQGTTDGESRVQNAAIGGGLGVLGQGVAAGVGRLAKGARDTVTPAIRESIDVLRQAGVPLHASQVVPSKSVKTLSSALSYLPLSGAGKAVQRQQEAFNRAVGKTFGADAPALTDEVMAQAKNAISRQYQDVFSRKAVQLDDQALSELGRLEQTLTRRLPQDQAAMVKANIDNVLANTENGVMPGEVYQALRGELAGDGAAGKVMRELRGILDNTAFRSVGAKDAQALKRANQMWANLRTAEKSLQQVSGASGNVRPASLYPLIRNGSTQEMRQLAKAGQNVLKDQIPDSGTAGRMMAYTALSGLGGGMALSGNDNVSTLGKALLLGATGGRLLNSPAAANYLINGGGPILKGLARTARPAPLLLPAVARAEN